MLRVEGGADWVEVDPGLVEVVVGEMAFSLCKICGRRMQCHSRANRQVSTVEATVRSSCVATDAMVE